MNLQRGIIKNLFVNLRLCFVLTILAIPSFLFGTIAIPSANAAEGDEHSITFVNASWTNTAGFLTYDYEGSKYEKDTGMIYGDHIMSEDLDFPEGATNMKATFEADAIGTWACIMSGDMTSDHEFKVTGTLFQHWWYWDGDEVEEC